MRMLERGRIACLLMVLAGMTLLPQSSQAGRCAPTPWDEIGPFYRPNAPLRGKIGSGYLLSGTVRSSVDCSLLRPPITRV